MLSKLFEKIYSFKVHQIQYYISLIKLFVCSTGIYYCHCSYITEKHKHQSAEYKRIYKLGCYSFSSKKTTKPFWVPQCMLYLFVITMGLTDLLFV